MINVTTNEFKRIVAEKPVVILPLGSFEQHGPAAYLGADYVIASHISELVAEKAEIICLPGIPFGFSKIHDSFAGTITIDEDLYCQLIKCVITKLKKHGVLGIVLLNAHGGNLIPLRKFLQEEERNVLFLEWYKLSGIDYFPNDHKSHAGSEELSVLAAINSQYVNEELVVDMCPAQNNPSIPNVWEKFEYITENGVHLYANRYDKRVGNDVISYVVNKATKVVLDFINNVKEQECESKYQI